MANHMTLRCGGCRQIRGLAMVEFVLTMPILLFVMIATAEIGRGLYQYTALTKAVRDGARYLADQGDGTSGVPVLSGTHLANAQRVTVYGNIAGTGTAVLPGLAVGNVTAIRVAGTDYVRVTATYRFRPVFGTISIPGAGTVAALTTFTATAVQRTLK